MLGKYRENGVAELSPNCVYQHCMRRRSMKRIKQIRISVVFNLAAHW